MNRGKDLQHTGSAAGENRSLSNSAYVTVNAEDRSLAKCSLSSDLLIPQVCGDKRGDSLNRILIKNNSGAVV